MHELGVTQEMINIALEKAKEADAKEIKSIDLVIGDLSGIIDDSVQFYFDFLTEGTIAHKAKLNFRRVPVKVHCDDCNIDFCPDDVPWVCPECDKWSSNIITGKEFYIESMEVE